MLRLLLAVFGCAAVGEPSSAADWPQFLGPNRDGVAGAKAVGWPEGGPKVVWRTEIGQGFAGPVIAEGKLILFHRVGNREVIDRLDPDTGKQVWRSEYRTGYVDDFGFDEGPRATPLISGDAVFTLGAAGDLRATDLKNGEELWARNLAKDYRASKGFFGSACSPVLAGGKLLLNVGGDGAGVVAFDPKTGEELWKASDDEASYSSGVFAEIDGKPTAVFFTRRGLLSLDPADGSVRFEKDWRARQSTTVNAATPLVHGDEIFLSASYRVGAILLRVGDGKLTEVWSGDEQLSSHYNTPLLADGFLYGIHGRQETGADLRCVEWATGKVRWEKDGFGCATLIGVGDRVLALAESGELVMFHPDPKEYREIGRERLLEKPVRAVPALSGDRLFARDGKTLIRVSFAD